MPPSSLSFASRLTPGIKVRDQGEEQLNGVGERSAATTHLQLERCGLPAARNKPEKGEHKSQRHFGVGLREYRASAAHCDRSRRGRGGSRTPPARGAHVSCCSGCKTTLARHAPLATCLVLKDEAADRGVDGFVAIMRLILTVVLGQFLDGHGGQVPRRWHGSPKSQGFGRRCVDPHRPQLCNPARIKRHPRLFPSLTRMQSSVRAYPKATPEFQSTFTLRSTCVKKRLT